MKQKLKKGCLLLFALCLAGGVLGCSGSNPGNKPYDPDTPAPAAHDGVFVSEHGNMRFNGDGIGIEIDFDRDLSELTGLPDGLQTGSYVFLSGDLPPNGSVPVRYDTAHEMQISIGDQSAVIRMGIASEDGSTAHVGVNTVTPERIPMLFYKEGKSFHVIFEKEESDNE